MVKIKAYIESINGNRAGDRSEKIRITASYESSNIMSTITYELPIDEAYRYYVGQELEISIS